jgi:chitosanase
MSRNFLLLLLFPVLAVAVLAMQEAPARAVAPRTLIKGNGPAVYYLADDGKRYVFPNAGTFASWYPSSMRPSIIKLSDAGLAAIPLGKNVTYRPGSKLLKIVSDPKVYAVSRYGVLHWVTSESLAVAIYGRDWNKKVVDVPDVFFVDYQIGEPLYPSTSYNPAGEMAAAKIIQDNMGKPQAAGDQWLTSDQKRRLEQITSVFENGTTSFDYGYVSNLNDGRGYTVGRVGFTTATGDAYQVASEYSVRKPQNALTKYLPKLKELADSGSDEVASLGSFPGAWGQATDDPVFREVQDHVVDELYYIPAMQAGDALGVKYPLSRAVLYDTIIQHGGGTDPDSLSAIIAKTNQAAGGTPSSGVDEIVWLKAFLQARKVDLLSASDATTRTVWAASAGRVDVLSSLVDARNYYLNQPIVINSKDYQATIN